MVAYKIPVTFCFNVTSYQNIRNDMLTAVSRNFLPTLYFLLYRSTAVSVNNNNCVIFKADQIFIRRSDSISKWYYSPN